MNNREIITIPASPISSTDYVTVLVPVHGCLVGEGPGNIPPPIRGYPAVSVTQATPFSDGIIRISVTEEDVICGFTGVYDALFAVPVGVGRLNPGLYYIYYPEYAISLYVTVSDTGNSIIPRAGLWVITSEANGTPGRGFQLQQHGATMVLTFYGYDTSGKGRFWLAAGPYSDGQFSGTLTAYDGGTPFGGPYQSAHAASDTGSVSLRFSSPTTGSITLPNETAKDISYFQF